MRTGSSPVFSTVGFTLIEVVLALTIFALMGRILYGAFFLGHRAVEKSQGSFESNQKLRSFGDLLGSYIRSTYPYRASPQDPTFFFEGEEDGLTFASSHSLGRRGSGRAKVHSERGVALIVVLWIFIFLFVVEFGFSASVREEAAAAGRYGDETQGYYLAIAGFEQGLYDFLSQSSGRELQQSQKSSDLFDGSWREQNLGGGVYRVRLIDEGGKININRVDEAILRRIFTNLGIEEPRRSILVDSIMDWRDPDDLHRVNGAETDYYL